MQTFWFKFVRPRRGSLEEEVVIATETTPLLINEGGSVNTERDKSLGAVSILAAVIPMFFGKPIEPAQRFIIETSVQVDNFDFYYEFGRLSAWICTCLYLFSRLPQIYHNFKRQSCDGLAITMFFCALMGNLTYAGSILIKQPNGDDLYAAMPYLLGSLGTIGFDLIIFMQYKYYPKRTIN